MSKYENWRELMDECGASGKPAKAWCLEHNISYNTYRGWLNVNVNEKVDQCSRCIFRPESPACTDF